MLLGFVGFEGIDVDRLRGGEFGFCVGEAELFFRYGVACEDCEFVAVHLGESAFDEECAVAASAFGVVWELQCEFAGAEFGDERGAVWEDAELAVPGGQDRAGDVLVEDLGLGRDDSAAETLLGHGLGLLRLRDGRFLTFGAAIVRARCRAIGLETTSSV